MSYSYLQRYIKKIFLIYFKNTVTMLKNSCQEKFGSVEGLTHSAAPSPAFKSGVKKRRSGSTLSKPRASGRGVEGLTPSVKSGRF
jgi:hypothetical protein